MNKLLMFLFLVLLMLSCKNRTDNSYGTILNNEKYNYKNNYKLIELGIKEFLLDEETVNLINHMQYIDSLEYLSFFNYHNQSIYFYDNNSSEFLHKTEIESVSGKIDGYYWDSNNIYAYSYNSKTLFWIDSNYKVKEKYLMSNDAKGSSNMIYPAPYIQTLAPLKKRNNKLLSVGFVAGETTLETPQNRTVVTILDLNDKSIKNAVNYPELYTLYNWAGGFTYRMPFYDISGESIVISFPACHNLIKYSLSTGKQSNHYAGSSSIESIKSYPFHKNISIDNTKAWEWYMNNPSYESVLYDPFRNLYYRIARLPKENYKTGEKGNRKPIVIIILDENLKYMGEINLPVNIYFYPSNCYVSKTGFNIQVLTEDEDKLTFYQYNFIENEK